MRSTSTLLALVLTVYTGAFLQAQPFFVSDCAPVTLCMPPGTCTSMFFSTTATAIATCNGAPPNYSWQLDLNNDISINRLGSGNTFSDTLPAGTHRIIFRAVDICFLAAFCEIIVTVKDCTPPNITAISGFAATLDPGDSCRLRLGVSSYLLNYGDNCTPKNQVQLRMRRAGTGSGFPTDTSAVFGRCDHGTNFLEIWARDNAGNTNQTNVYILIQDPQNQCPCDTITPPPPPPPPPPPTNVTLGCVIWPDSTAFDSLQYQVLMQIPVGAGLPNGLVGIDTTNLSCYTGVAPAVPANTQYLLYPNKTNDVLYEVNLIDVLLIQRHILGLATLTSPFALKAADVNNTVSITSSDIVEMRKLILGATTQLPVPSFQFFSGRVYAASGKLSPFDTLTSASLPPYHFFAIKSGNVDKFYRKNFTVPVDRAPISIEVTDQIEAGHLTIRSNEENLLGLQFALFFDPQKVEIIPGQYPGCEVFLAAAGEARMLIQSIDGLTSQHAWHIPVRTRGAGAGMFALNPDYPALAVSLHQGDLLEHPIELRQDAQAVARSVYPNPVQKGAPVFLGSANGLIEAHSLTTGQATRLRTSAAGWFDTSSLNAGVYLLIDGSQMHKLIVLE